MSQWEQARARAVRGTWDVGSGDAGGTARRRHSPAGQGGCGLAGLATPWRALAKHSCSDSHGEK